MDAKDVEIMNEMMGVSDRAAAIVGAAYLEDKLSDAIRSRLVDDENALKQVLRPGSLARKAEWGYLLHLYSKETRDEILRLNRIRNRFAHWARPVSFDNEEIRTDCAQLNFHHRMAKWAFPEYERPSTDVIEPAANAKFQYAQFVDTLCTVLYGKLKNPITPSV